MASWWLYVLSCGDGTLYTGISNDVDARLEAHAAGKGARYTRGRGPLELVYRERCKDRSSALKREHAVKRLSRTAKLTMVRERARPSGRRAGR